MAQFQLEEKKVLFVGIGGVGMRPLSILFRKAGFKVFGYDKKLNKVNDEYFSQFQIEILIDNSQLVIEEIDYVIYSQAVPYSNNLLEYARNLSKIVITRSEGIDLLNNIIKKSIISVSGTNGKGAITSLLACLFKEGNRSPTVLCGANMKNYGESFILGNGSEFIVEACEYKQEFDKFNHQVFILSNIAVEHLDYYKGGIEEIVNAFIKQVDKTIASNGLVIANCSNKLFNELTSKYIGNQNLIKIFDPSSNWSVREEKLVDKKYFSNIEVWKNGKLYDSYILDKRICTFVENILPAVIVADYYLISKEHIKNGLTNYKGLSRRFENFKLKNNNILIYDYASHPDSIEYSISVVREIYNNKKIYSICTLRQYHRTKSQMSMFSHVLSNSDKCLLLPITPGLGDKKPYDSSILETLKDSINKVNSNKATVLSKYEIKNLYRLIRNSEDSVFYLTGTGDNKLIFDTILENEAL